MPVLTEQTALIFLKNDPLEIERTVNYVLYGPAGMLRSTFVDNDLTQHASSAENYPATPARPVSRESAPEAAMEPTEQIDRDNDVLKGFVPGSSAIIESGTDSADNTDLKQRSFSTGMWTGSRVERLHTGSDAKPPAEDFSSDDLNKNLGLSGQEKTSSWAALTNVEPNYEEVESTQSAAFTHYSPMDFFSEPDELPTDFVQTMSARDYDDDSGFTQEEPPENDSYDLQDFQVGKKAVPSGVGDYWNDDEASDEMVELAPLPEKIELGGRPSKHAADGDLIFEPLPAELAHYFDEPTDSDHGLPTHADADILAEMERARQEFRSSENSSKGESVGSRQERDGFSPEKFPESGAAEGGKLRAQRFSGTASPAQVNAENATSVNDGTAGNAAADSPDSAFDPPKKSLMEKLFGWLPFFKSKSERTLDVKDLRAMSKRKSLPPDPSIAAQIDLQSQTNSSQAEQTASNEANVFPSAPGRHESVEAAETKRVHVSDESGDVSPSRPPQKADPSDVFSPGVPQKALEPEDTFIDSGELKEESEEADALGDFQTRRLNGSGDQASTEYSQTDAAGDDAADPRSNDESPFDPSGGNASKKIAEFDPSGNRAESDLEFAGESSRNKAAPGQKEESSPFSEVAQSDSGGEVRTKFLDASDENRKPPITLEAPQAEESVSSASSDSASRFRRLRESTSSDNSDDSSSTKSKNAKKDSRKRTTENQVAAAKAGRKGKSERSKPFPHRNTEDKTIQVGPVPISSNFLIMVVVACVFLGFPAFVLLGLVKNIIADSDSPMVPALLRNMAKEVAPADVPGVPGLDGAKGGAPLAGLPLAPGESPMGPGLQGPGAQPGQVAVMPQPTGGTLQDVPEPLPPMPPVQQSTPSVQEMANATAPPVMTNPASGANQKQPPKRVRKPDLKNLSGLWALDFKNQAGQIGRGQMIVEQRGNQIRGNGADGFGQYQIGGSINKLHVSFQKAYLQNGRIVGNTIPYEGKLSMDKKRHVPRIDGTWKQSRREGYNTLSHIATYTFAFRAMMLEMAPDPQELKAREMQQRAQAANQQSLQSMMDSVPVNDSSVPVERAGPQ